MEIILIVLAIAVIGYFAFDYFKKSEVKGKADPAPKVAPKQPAKNAKKNK